MTNAEFLESDTVVFLHDAAIAAYGGSTGLNDANMLESALARPRNRLAYAESGSLDLFDLAAAYAFSLVKNLPSAMGTGERDGLPQSFSWPGMALKSMFRTKAQSSP